jgi:tetratricopeptide (TPR) repeat protein
MRRARLFLTGAALVLGAAGCTTTERDLPNTGTREHTVPGDTTSQYEVKEEVFVEATEDNPEDPVAWFNLGDFYERNWSFGAAAQAYERFHQTTEAIRPNYFTAGHYHLGRIYARLKEWQLAVFHLGKVLDLKPDDDTQAVLNAHFREAHYLLGVVYYQHKQWEPAREHLIAYKAISGEDLRADQILAEIDMKQDDLLGSN